MRWPRSVSSCQAEEARLRQGDTQRDVHLTQPAGQCVLGGCWGMGFSKASVANEAGPGRGPRLAREAPGRAGASWGTADPSPQRQERLNPKKCSGLA